LISQNSAKQAIPFINPIFVRLSRFKYPKESNFEENKSQVMPNILLTFPNNTHTTVPKRLQSQRPCFYGCTDESWLWSL